LKLALYGCFDGLNRIKLRASFRSCPMTPSESFPKLSETFSMDFRDFIGVIPITPALRVYR
jgi:hypothetical protein